MHWSCQEWIKPGQHGRHWCERTPQVRSDASRRGVVIVNRRKHIEMVLNRIIQSRKRSIVEEGWLQGHIAKRTCAELIAIIDITGDLLQTEVLVLPWTIKGYIAG